MNDRHVTVYGLKTCDTCRKSVQALKADGYEVSLVDVRAAPLTEAHLSGWLSQFGDALLNTRSTTWRGLSTEERAAPPLELLRAHPALMKRPVIVKGGIAHLGWTAEAKAALLQTK